MKAKILTSALALATASVAGMTTAQAAEVGASVGVSNFYLWRGVDLGTGSPAVWGDINVSEGPFYSGVWTSSGDDALGTEVDVYAGVGHSMGDLSLDLSYWSYIYPTSDIGLGDVADVIASIGYGPVTFTAVNPVSAGSNSDFSYLSLGADYGQFSALVGYHTEEAGAVAPEDYWHLNLGYAYNDNLGFTVVVPLDGPNDTEMDPMFNVALSLPIEF